MAEEAIIPPETTRSLPQTKKSRSAENMTPDEAFLDDIRVSLQEIEAGQVLDSRQRIREIRAQLKHAKDDC